MGKRKAYLVSKVIHDAEDVSEGAVEVVCNGPAVAKSRVDRLSDGWSSLERHGGNEDHDDV